MARVEKIGRGNENICIRRGGHGTQAKTALIIVFLDTLTSFSPALSTWAIIVALALRLSAA